MVQTVVGVLVLLTGGYFLWVGIRRTMREGAQEHKGFLGRFGLLMVGILVTLVGVALVVPAQNAEPEPGQGAARLSLESLL